MNVFLGLVAIGLAVSCAVDRDDLVLSFSETFPEATADEAACVVDELVNVYGVEGVEERLTSDTVDDEFRDKQLRTMVHCGMTDLIAEPLEAQLFDLDVPRSKRPCVVTELTADISDADLDVLFSGEITDEYYAKFFDALTTCDALP